MPISINYKKLSLKIGKYSINKFFLGKETKGHVYLDIG